MTPLVRRHLNAHRRQIKATGEEMTLRRGSGVGAESLAVWGRIMGFDPDELVGDIKQGDRKAIILAEDVTFNPPLRPGDRIMLRGQPLNITAVDDSTRRVGGMLIAYEVTARGQ